MVEGVRYLPWLAALERLDDSQAKLFDCKTCKRGHERESRRHMRCGWIPESEWLADYPHHFMKTPSPDHHETACPGYTTQLPAVHEVACCFAWREKGQLQLRYPDGISDELIALLDIYAVSQNLSEQYEYKEHK